MVKRIPTRWDRPPSSPPASRPKKPPFLTFSRWTHTLLAPVGTAMSRAGRPSVLCTGAAGARTTTCVHRHRMMIGLCRTAIALATTWTDFRFKAACSTAAGNLETLPAAAADITTLTEAEGAFWSLVADGSAASVAEGMRSGAAALMMAAEPGCDTQQSREPVFEIVTVAADAAGQGTFIFRGAAALLASVVEAVMPSPALLEACAHL